MFAYDSVQKAVFPINLPLSVFSEAEYIMPPYIVVKPTVMKLMNPNNLEESSRTKTFNLIIIL